MKKVGLLPLFLELYDDTCSFMRPRVENFRDIITSELTSRGLDIICAPICRLKQEFNTAVKDLEAAGAEIIITLHLAYSPSLECIDALANTKLPLAILDTTESYEFDPTVSSEEILYNHGIHGVQDMCNLLKRREKPYQIFAGHYKNSDVLNRVVKYCYGVKIASAFRGARVGLVGKPFDGMGDFNVPEEELARLFGIKVIKYDLQAGAKRIADVTTGEIEAERGIDKKEFTWDASVTNELYNRSAKVCLALRKWVDEQKLTALSVNFLATEGGNPGLPVMPFTECSKAMVRGIGYAGEGDTLTAALCGAVLQTFPQASFTEMFCPDWKGGSIFLSHMGEINYKVCAKTPRLTEKDFPFTSADNPTVAYGTFQPGNVVYVNLAPCGNEKYILILAPGEVLAVTGDNNMEDSVNGWFRPNRPLSEFLEEFSKAGGTHHSVIVYADCIEEMTYFAALMGFDCIII